jgi:hypothetical protein
MINVVHIIYQMEAIADPLKHPTFVFVELHLKADLKHAINVISLIIRVLADSV